MSQTRPANAVAAHFEPFKDFAFAQLDAAPLITPGVCFRPECGQRFNPSREWQIYCCAACRVADTAEARAWGHKAALPLLVHRVGKYETKNQAIRERTRVARQYVTRLQSAWLEDRKLRAGS